MSFKLVVTPAFEKEAKSLLKKHKSLKQDLQNLFYSLEENPFQGVALGNDCFKIRMAITSKGKGKSAGAHVITCIKITKETIYLLSVYDESEKQDISDKQLSLLIRYTL